MEKIFLKNQIHVLLSIQADTAIQHVNLLPFTEGFGFRIEGNCSKNLLEQISHFMECYLKKENGILPPLNLDHMKTPFTQNILEGLADIPFGKTLTYQELGALRGCPKGARAVGGACGRNPFPFFLPCHRVLGSKGLGGFSCGIGIKKRLLLFEANS